MLKELIECAKKNYKTMSFPELCDKFNVEIVHRPVVRKRLNEQGIKMKDSRGRKRIEL